MGGVLFLRVDGLGEFDVGDGGDASLVESQSGLDAPVLEVGGGAVRGELHERVERRKWLSMWMAMMFSPTFGCGRRRISVLDARGAPAKVAPVSSARVASYASPPRKGTTFFPWPGKSGEDAGKRRNVPTELRASSTPDAREKSEVL